MKPKKYPEQVPQVIEVNEDFIKREIALWVPLQEELNKLSATPFIKYVKIRTLRYMMTTMILDMELSGQISEEKKLLVDKLFKQVTQGVLKANIP